MMAQMKPAVAMVSGNTVKCEAMRMQICSIPSVQRVVNFSVDDGKMYFGEHFGGTVPEVATICDLPLLFVNGFLSSLENLSLDQVETFVPYMIECCVGGSCEFRAAAPKWWPRQVEFSLRPQRPLGMQESDWLKYLKIIVSNCYSHHGCEFALNLGAVPSARNKTPSVVWPYLNDICDKSAALISNKITCFENNVGVKPHLPSRNEEDAAVAHQYYSQLHCAVCGTKFRRAQEIRRHKKLCLSSKRDPRHRTDSNRMPHDIGAAAATLNNNYYSSTNQNQRMRKTNLTKKKRSPTRVLQVKLTDINWLPSVVLRDCMKGGNNVNTDHGCSSARSKPRPLSSSSSSKGGGEGKETRNNSWSSEEPQVKRRRKTKGARRSLLQEVIKKEKIPMIPIQETYNCDSCGLEFLSREDKEEHITLPCQDRDDLPPESPGDIIQTQESFMKYFGLVDSSKPLKQDNSRARTFRNPIRYSGVPISSPLGNLIFGRSRISSSVFLAKIEKVERYCAAKPLSLLPNLFPMKKTEELLPPLPSCWEVSWKEKPSEDSDHYYFYPLKRWWKSPMVWEKEFKKRIAYLKKIKLCKPCHVVLRRLKLKEIERNDVTAKESESSDLSRAKETFQAKRSLKMTFTMVPKIKRLTQKEVDAYTNVVTPMLKRLTDQEIKKYSK